MHDIILDMMWPSVFENQVKVWRKPLFWHLSCYGGDLVFQNGPQNIPREDILKNTIPCKF